MNFSRTHSCKKDDDFLKSPAEAPDHRKVLLKDKDIKGFDKLCEKYEDIISKKTAGHRKDNVS